MILSWSRSLLICAALSSAACSQKIGDSCKTTADCTSGTDRLCDRTLPGGYCTMFNCEPDGCPSEAVCVGYRSSLGTTSECESHEQASRLERTFCMRTCNSDADCRDGYACLDFSSDDPQLNPWSAEIVDNKSSKVCSVPYSGPAPSPRESDVCREDLPLPGSSITDAASPAPLDASGDAATANRVDAALDSGTDAAHHDGG